MDGNPYMMVLASGGGFPSWLLPETQVLIWSVIVFVSLLGLLWKFAWGPLMKALDQREQRIQARFNEATARVTEAEVKVRDYEERVRHIEDEARRYREKARQDAERISAEIQSKGRAEVERLVDRARREIDLARAKAADDLKNQSADMVVRVAERVLREHFSAEEHREYIEQCIARYEESDR